ncbi:MAG TPA: DUF4785 domain-containing protein [Wenzhouxiangellaceae bacterium]|nr:DUF4785 domain-containing protein [Wenzhouxiangellaceae bacterium]
MKNTIFARAALPIACLSATLIAGTSLAQTNPARPDLEIRAADGPAALSSTWLDARTGDFGPQSLGIDPAVVPDSRHAETAPVKFAWALEGVTAESLGRSSARVESRQYWVDATGADLAGGVSLPLTSRGAVIRVSPLEAGGDVAGDIGIDPASVQLSVNGKRFDSTRSMMQVTDGASLQRLGMSVPPQTIAFKLDKIIPPGKLDLAVARLPADQKLVVHVFEPDSDWVAELALPRDTFVAGETLEFGFGLGDGQGKARVDSVQAVLADPYADKTWALEIDKTSGTLTRRAPADRFVSGQDGLFEAYVYLETVQDGLTIRRDLKLPVSIVPPLARFTGQTVATLDDGLTIEVGVQTAVSGRFQLNGQIFGTAADGSLKPLAMAQSAAVIDGRAGSIELQVTGDMLMASGLRAPFEVRNLELLDQGRMFVLQRRQSGLLLDD